MCALLMEKRRLGILEKGLFHKLEERQYFSLEQFNKDLWKELEALNKEPFKKKEHNSQR